MQWTRKLYVEYLAITGTLYTHTLLQVSSNQFCVPLTWNLILARNSHVFIANLQRLLCPSCRTSRLCWNLIMTIVLHLLSLFIPFAYTRFLSRSRECTKNYNLVYHCRLRIELILLFGRFIKLLHSLAINCETEITLS